MSLISVKQYLLDGLSDSRAKMRDKKAIKDMNFMFKEERASKRKGHVYRYMIHERYP